MNNKSNKTVCVFHSADLDGWMSAAIVKHWFITTNNHYTLFDKDRGNLYNSRGITSVIENNSLDFKGYNYGQSIPDLSEYDKVIMCDISFPKEEMLNLAVNKDFTWIDHHISAIKDNDELIEAGSLIHPKGRLDTTYSACELTWQYFFPNESMPEIVRLLGRYDCFGHKGTDEEQQVLEFQYGARQTITNYEEAYQSLCMTDFDSKPTQYVLNILNNGANIYQYLCTEAKQSYKNGFEIRLFTYTEEDHMNPHKFICINRERFNPINFGIDYHKDGYDGCACFHYDGKAKLYRFSLYNDNGLVDCSIIAKQFGGGGHKGAAGFILTQEQFDKLINGRES